MAEVANLREAAVTIEELQEEIRRENDRKYAFYRMLTATDRVLWRLEELNLREVAELPTGAGQRIRDELIAAGLPDAALEKLRGGSVQQVMDGLYDAQEALLRWRDPNREVEEDGEPRDRKPIDGAELSQKREAFRQSTLRRLERFPTGVARSYLAAFANQSREIAHGWLDELEAEGLVRFEAVPAGRRYFAVGEGG